MSASAGQEGRADSISLSEEEAVKQVLVDSVLGLWDVVNGLTRLRPSRRDRYRVSIFGSARARPGTFAYEEDEAGGQRAGRTSTATSSPGVAPGSCRPPTRAPRPAAGRPSPWGSGSTCRSSRRSMPFVENGVRASDLLHATPSVRAHLGRVHRGAGRDRHGARDDDGLAAPPGAAPAVTPPSSSWAGCGPASSNGRERPCSRTRPAPGQCGGHEYPAMPLLRRGSHRGAAGASRAVAPRTEQVSRRARSRPPSRRGRRTRTAWPRAACPGSPTPRAS